MRPCVLRLIKSFCDNEVLVCRAAGYYGHPFKSERGVIQGDPLSPTIFNLMLDAIVREWIFQMEAAGFDTADTRVITVIFYADDNLIAARDSTLLQDAFNLLINLFDRVDLETNSTKTEVMVSLPGRIRTCLSEDVYLSRLHALYWADRKGGKVKCHTCRRKFRKGSLASHLASQHGIYHSHLLAGADTCQPMGESRMRWARHLPVGGVW